MWNIAAFLMKRGRKSKKLFSVHEKSRVSLRLTKESAYLGCGFSYVAQQPPAPPP